MFSFFYSTSILTKFWLITLQLPYYPHSKNQEGHNDLCEKTQDMHHFSISDSKGQVWRIIECTHYVKTSIQNILHSQQSKNYKCLYFVDPQTTMKWDGPVYCFNSQFYFHHSLFWQNNYNTDRQYQLQKLKHKLNTATVF